MRTTGWVLLGVLLIPSITPAQHEGVAPTPATPAPKVDFARHVRPILAQHCYTCHGPDDKQRKGKLRLDRAEFAFAPRDNGPDTVGAMAGALWGAANGLAALPAAAIARLEAAAQIDEVARDGSRQRRGLGPDANSMPP